MKENDIFRTVIPLNIQENAQVNEQVSVRNTQVIKLKVTEKAIIDFCIEPKTLKEIV